MHAQSLIKNLAIITIIAVCVCVSFKYLLPLVFPFILAYMFMRMLLPVIHFLYTKAKLPVWFAYGSVLTVFFLSASGIFILLVWLICRQFQLLINNFPIYRQLYNDLFVSCLNKCCNCIDYYFSIQDGTSLNFINEKIAMLKSEYIDTLFNNAGQIFSSCISIFTRVITIILITTISMIVLCKDINIIHKSYRKSRFYGQIHKILYTLKTTGLSYIKSQGIIICANWFVCSIAFMLIKNPYFVIIGLLISLIDALPILGSGIILCPVGIYYIFKSNFLYAAIMFTAYIITIFVREILEAKLLGNNMNILPFFMLLSIYSGLKIFGISGIVLGPFAVVITRAIYDSIIAPDI